MTTGPGAERRGVVVIGVGNEFRRDDGIGPEVLSRLRGHAADGVRLVASDGEPARMIEAWTGARLAVVIDAVLAGPPPPAHLPIPASPSLSTSSFTVPHHSPCPGRLHRIVVDRTPAGDVHTVSTHGLGLGESVALARALDRMPERLIVHAVEVTDVGRGVGLTPAVAAAADALTAAVLRDLQHATIP
jgi:hydrogenase maturation protease